ncbi:GMP reductase, partial [Staphylococcus pseudintermedius]|uniref:IMP dehydrogenase n=1 Tax=Staphylococcus pseudintermedius TaxID=283734 RepID=UPI000E38C85D
IRTGFWTGGWQFAALNHCSKAARKPIIADGGIRTHGYIAKSVCFDASMVNTGSLFAATNESTGVTVEIDAKKDYKYFVSAAEYQKGERKNDDVNIQLFEK